MYSKNKADQLTVFVLCHFCIKSTHIHHTIFELCVSTAAGLFYHQRKNIVVLSCRGEWPKHKHFVKHHKCHYERENTDAGLFHIHIFVKSYYVVSHTKHGYLGVFFFLFFSFIIFVLTIMKCECLVDDKNSFFFLSFFL